MSNAKSLALPLAFAAIATATLLLIALLPGASHGESLEAIQARLHQVQGKLGRVRGHEHVLRSQIAALSGRIGSLQREIGTLRRRESRVANTLAAKRVQLERVKAQYEREHARYVRLQHKLKRAQGVLADRLVAIYKSDPPDFLTVVLNSDGFQDLLERAEYLGRIGEQDAAIVDRVHTLKEESARKRQILLSLKESAQAAVDAIEAKQR